MRVKIGVIVIKKGDIYWVTLPNKESLGNGIDHPHVVLQDTILNQSRISSVVACALSTNMKRAFDPGNILLEQGEAGLEKESFVVVSQVSIVPKESLGAYIGCLDNIRIEQIFQGIALQQNIIAGRQGADSGTSSAT